MATSGTTSFNLELDELFDEAYGRVGIGTARSGNHLIGPQDPVTLAEWFSNRQAWFRGGIN